MSELLQRIANYFVYQYKGNDKVAPKMDMSVDDLRNIVVLNVKKCKLEAELRNLQYVKTNADRIRNMSDEELAEWLTNMCDTERHEEPYKSIYNLDTEHEEEIHDSYGDLLKWLQAEVDRRKQNEKN